MKVKKYLKQIYKKWFFVVPGLGLIIAITLIAFFTARAEQSGGSPESGATSYIKTTYDLLVSTKHGSDSSGSWGNWGAYQNRIKSATDLIPAGCSTQQYQDDHASALEGNNCSLTWVDPGDAITGTDARSGRGGKDPRTGLIWSQLLYNNAGTVEFSATLNSAWSWDTSGANNIAVGNKTASQLCSERGNSWRLPTQKELQQAYIDGSFWNLTQASQSSYTFHSATEYDAANMWYVELSAGTTYLNSKSSLFQVRCVR